MPYAEEVEQLGGRDLPEEVVEEDRMSFSGLVMGKSFEAPSAEGRTSVVLMPVVPTWRVNPTRAIRANDIAVLINVERLVMIAPATFPELGFTLNFHEVRL